MTRARMAGIVVKRGRAYSHSKAELRHCALIERAFATENRTRHGREARQRADDDRRSSIPHGEEQCPPHVLRDFELLVGLDGKSPTRAERQCVKCGEFFRRQSSP